MVECAFAVRMTARFLRWMTVIGFSGMQGMFVLLVGDCFRRDIVLFRMFLASCFLCKESFRESFVIGQVNLTLGCFLEYSYYSRDYSVEK